MYKIGLAQEIITPPVGVGLAGYMNKRPNVGMYDDLQIKTMIIESNGTKCGFMTFDLCSITAELFEDLEKRIVEKFGKEMHDNLIISATHTHTGPSFYAGREKFDDVTRYAYENLLDSAVRCLERAIMNLLPGEIQVGSVYNNPYGFVRRYFMKSGAIVTNPGWRNPDIDRPESDFDRTISIMKIVQDGRITAIMCNITNHGDTVGGSVVCADWYGRFAQEIPHTLKASMPVLVLDDASGDINHFDFSQKINQSSYKEAVRVGRGYAHIVLEALGSLQKLESDEIIVKNSTVTIPHRKLTPEEVAEAQHILDTVPDIPKEGDFESQDLANKVPAALRYFAKSALRCHAESSPSHDARLTTLEFGKELAFVSLPGEPFNGIAREIREKSPFKNTFIISLAQTESDYVPLKECFARGGYEVQPGVDSLAPEAAEEIVKAALKNL
jgi:hypothetical protein